MELLSGKHFTTFKRIDKPNTLREKLCFWFPLMPRQLMESEELWRALEEEQFRIWYHLPSAFERRECVAAASLFLDEFCSLLASQEFSLMSQKEWDFALAGAKRLNMASFPNSNSSLRDWLAKNSVAKKHVATSDSVMLWIKYQREETLSDRFLYKKLELLVRMLVIEPCRYIFCLPYRASSASVTTVSVGDDVTQARVHRASLRDKLPTSFAILRNFFSVIEMKESILDVVMIYEYKKVLRVKEYDAVPLSLLSLTLPSRSLHFQPDSLSQVKLCALLLFSLVSLIYSYLTSTAEPPDPSQNLVPIPATIEDASPFEATDTIYFLVTTFFAIIAFFARYLFPLYSWMACFLVPFLLLQDIMIFLMSYAAATKLQQGEAAAFLYEKILGLDLPLVLDHSYRHACRERDKNFAILFLYRFCSLTNPEQIAQECEKWEVKVTSEQVKNVLRKRVQDFDEESDSWS